MSTPDGRCNQLVQWLERKARQQDITQPILLEFVRRAVRLARREARPALNRPGSLALHSGESAGAENWPVPRTGERRSLSANLFGPEAAVETSFDYAFDFTPNGYASRWNYEGHPYQFQKHFYPFVGELENKGEEYECAKALDLAGKVKHWVRNLERRGFWLPLAKGNFYPDFVAELTDGRILALEHKGKVYATNDDSKEKSCVGGLWEQASNGKALFLMTVVEKGKAGLGRADRGEDRRPVGVIAEF